MSSFALALSLVYLTTPGAEPGLSDLSFAPSEITKSVQTGMRRIALAAKPDVAITKVPENGPTMWGRLTLGPRGSSREVVIGVRDSADPKVWVDANSDHDLTNDAPVAIEVDRTASGAVRTIRGAFEVSLPKLSDKPVRVRFHRYGTEESARRKLPPDVLFCYADYGWRGRLTVGDKSYPVIISDEAVDGDFSYDGGKTAEVAIYVDQDANGEFEPLERYWANDTINVGDAAVVVEKISDDGRTIKLARAGIRDPQIRPSDSIGGGGKALAFKARALDGGEVKFPDDYKGKLVLLDFWATWCGPCRQEIPHLVKTYEQHRHHSFDVLGVTIDKPGADATLRDFLGKNKMPWRQVFPGQDVSRQWGVSSIPRMFLIDGDTGEILASGGALRNGALIDVVDKAIEKKFGGDSAQHSAAEPNHK